MPATSACLVRNLAGYEGPVELDAQCRCIPPLDPGSRSGYSVASGETRGTCPGRAERDPGLRAAITSARIFECVRHSEREHEQHRLVALLAQLRRELVPPARDRAPPGEHRDILLAVDLERHRPRVEADPDIALPQLLDGAVAL